MRSAKGRRRRRRRRRSISRRGVWWGHRARARTRKFITMWDRVFKCKGAETSTI